MGQALYRKYRSKSFDELVGQEHITKTLQNAIKTGKISHAYLFTGPRGTGKTSVARILAHAVNDLPYTDESIHLDIIEIDAASNRRIDEIRELRDKVHIAPTSAKYKVYIIDEVHMLTREAFNALLKTLEEPPAHCIFILATTEVHKLPETIISRTQRFSFKPASKENIEKLITNMAESEKIEITKDALELLAEHGSGSFRDSVSLFDQLAGSGKKITAEDVRSSLGIPPEDAIENLVTQISNGNSAEILSTLENLTSQGVSPAQTAAHLGKKLRQELIDGHTKTWTANLLRELLNVPGSVQPSELLEISLLEAASLNTSPVTKKEVKKDPPVKSEPEEVSAKIEPKIIIEDVKDISEPVSEQVDFTDNFDINRWPEIVEYSKKKAASLYTALRLAMPEFADSTLTLTFQFPLHQKKLNQAKHKDLLGQIIEEVVGSKVRIEVVVDKNKFKNSMEDVIQSPVKKEESAEKPSEHLQNISNIFGTAEVLES